MPRVLSAACMIRRVLLGNELRFFHIETACRLLRPVNEATSRLPPSASITSSMELSRLIMGLLYLTKREVVKPQEIEIGICQNLNKVGSMQERRETGGKSAPIARRFRAIMRATAKPHENATQWAYRMGLGPTAVSNFRNGIPVSARAADLIATRTGIGSDYIRRGDERFLTVDMRQRLEEALETLDREEGSEGLSGKRQNVSP